MTKPLSDEILPQAAEAVSKKSRYLFDPDVLHASAKKAMGLDHQEMVKSVCDDLMAAYPGHIDPNVEWIFNVTAGVTGVMKILHASLSEYVILFGTPTGSEGFSGRYSMDIWDFQITGKTWNYTEQRFWEKLETKPGGSMYLPRGKVKGVRIFEDSWMLEYGRGKIPLALPIALGDGIFSCLDGTTIAKTLFYYGRATVREMLKGKF